MRVSFLAPLILALAVVLSPPPRPALAAPAVLFDAGDGRVLYAEDADDAWYPASLTKMMSAYIAFSALKAGTVTMEQDLVVSELAHAQPPSKVGLPVGGTLNFEVGLRAMIIKSANDVSVMIAEAIAGSEPAFVARMNETAARLGMTRTRFLNPHGLPAPEQASSARDLAKLARALVRDFPEHAHYWAMPDMRIGQVRLRSHNALLRSLDGADGIKTGFTCDSGYNVVASATRDGRRLVAVVLGAVTGEQRAIRAAALLEHGFATQAWKRLSPGVTLDSLPASPDVKPLASVRSSVLAWSCGHRPSRQVATGKAAKVTAVRAKVAAARAKGRARQKVEAKAPAEAPKAVRRPVPKRGEATAAAGVGKPPGVASAAPAPAAEAAAGKATATARSP